MTRQRVPADQVALHRGDVVYRGNNGHWRGTIDHIRADGRLSVSYDNGEGDNRAPRSEFTVEARSASTVSKVRGNGNLAENAHPAQWQQDLRELAERQVKLPKPRQFKNGKLAGALLLWIAVAMISGNAIVVLTLTLIFCCLPLAKRSER